MADLSFRDAVAADIPIVLALSDAGAVGGLSPDPSTYSDPRYLAAFAAIADSPHHRLIAAEHLGEVIGTLQLSFIPGLPRFGMMRGVIENVHIRSDLRGSGFGSQMLVWAVQQCRDAGCGVAQLTSNKQRHDAHRFYSKLGFEQSHEGFKLWL